MRFHVLTIFPGMFASPLSEGTVKRAIERGLVEVHLHNIRDYTHDRHRTVDDYPFGGGGGMVMKPEPLFEAVESLRASGQMAPDSPVVLLSPQGRTLTQRIVEELATHRELVFICGRYEGVDERVREHLATDELSIGDYVLSGGELAAMVVMEAVTRLVPGAVGFQEAIRDDTFTAGLLQYPQYTRPADFRGWTVPEVLLSGNHSEVARWRRRESLRRTYLRRPDLLKTAPLSDEDRQFIQGLEGGRDQGGTGKQSPE